MEEVFTKDKKSIEEEEEEDGELPEEGEIMDDEEEKNQLLIQKEEKDILKQKTPESEQIKEIKELSPNRSSEFGSEKQQIINSEFQRGSSSWRKSFGSAGHHGGSGRGSGRFSRGGNESNVRYRDFDGRVAMRNNDQQEEEMLDSWNACVRGGIHHHHHNNYRRRMNSPSGDISPIRTSPMIEEDEEKDFNISESLIEKQSQLKKQTEITVTQQQIDDDKDFRGIDSTNTIESNNSSPQNKQSPRQQYSDDNDFRRSSIQQPNFNRQTSPHSGQFEGNRRRHRSQSPPVNISAKPQFPHESEDFDTPYGNSAKRYRPYYESGPPGGDEFTQKDENFGHFPSFDENGPWSSRPHRGAEEGDFPHQFNYGGDRGGRGWRTQGWGYRGGRPFFPRLICKFFREGFCRDGDQCTFSHLTGDSHRRPELCRYYQQGYCKKGLFCQLMHGEWPCKAFHKGECSKEQCSFSHEPLDDVSRPIMDKILEEERLGLTRPSQQQHQRFDTPQQQTPHMGRGIRPFFRPRFQGPYQNQPGGQNFSQSQGPQQPPQQQFHRNPHQQIGLGAPPPPQQQQPLFKHPQQSVDETFVPVIQIPPSPENLHHETSEINTINEESGGICQQQQPSIPPPGLVMPPPLGGGSPLPLPQNSSSATFGFFNPVSSSTSSSNQPPQNIQSQPPPSFQQLQQQVHQVAGPHFPHQPSLLGPSSAAAQAQAMLTAILQQSHQQQIGSTPTKGDFRDHSLQRSPPPPPPKKKEEMPQSNMEGQQLHTKTEVSETELKTTTNTGGFNINQMLEQITKQNSPPPQSPPALTSIKKEEVNTLDLLANVGLSENKANIVEESPASPIFPGEQQQENENKPAALIPVVREWKLHLVDLSPLIEGFDMHFDIKLVQQISSSNSDPRLRKIAEKQFDLVSKTLEQQQANQQKNNSNEEIFTQTEQIKKESEKNEIISGNYEIGLQDPRTKDPRRRKELSGSSGHSEIDKTSNIRTSFDEAELVKKQMAALEAAAKQQQNCEQSPQLFSNQLDIRQQIGLPPPNINFQLPPPAFLPGNPMANSFFNVPPPPPPFSLQQQLPQNFSTPPPSTYHQQQQINQIVNSQQKLEAQSFNNEQLPCSSSIDSSKSSNNSFGKTQSETSSFPPYKYSGGYRGRRGRYSHHNYHQHQQHYREYNQQNRRSESPPKQSQQQEEENASTSSAISLREKRKNNEYESPLARMASNRY